MMPERPLIDIRLVPEFSGVATDLPIVDRWVSLRALAMDKVERVLPSRLIGGALAVYRRLSKELKADSEADQTGP